MNKVSTCAKEFETFWNLDGPDCPIIHNHQSGSHLHLQTTLQHRRMWQEPGAQLHLVDVKNTSELRHCCFIANALLVSTKF